MLRRTEYLKWVPAKTDIQKSIQRNRKIRKNNTHKRKNRKRKEKKIDQRDILFDVVNLLININ